MPVVGGGIGAAVASFYDDSRARTGGGGGGAIKFDADGIDDVIKRLKGLIADDLREAADYAQRLQRMDDAGHPVGDDYATTVRGYGAEYNNWREDYVEAIKATIAKLEGIKKDYLERDDAAARTFNGGLND